MPSWKKVIVSGSDTHLNNITASAGIQVNSNLTGSLTSTGSFCALRFGGDKIYGNKSTTFIKLNDTNPESFCLIIKWSMLASFYPAGRIT